MAIPESARQDVRLAEDVAVLSVLDALPGEIVDNPLPPGFDERDPRRVLSFERERFLASGLAALADISDDPNHVVAVAVEERPSPQGLAVLVAINRGNPRSAEGTLARIKKGLQGIFNILAEVGHGTVLRGFSVECPNMPKAATLHASMKCSTPSSTFAAREYSSA